VPGHSAIVEGERRRRRRHQGFLSPYRCGAAKRCHKGQTPQVKVVLHFASCESAPSLRDAAAVTRRAVAVDTAAHASTLITHALHCHFTNQKLGQLTIQSCVSTHTRVPSQHTPPQTKASTKGGTQTRPCSTRRSAPLGACGLPLAAMQHSTLTTLRCFVLERRLVARRSLTGAHRSLSPVRATFTHRSRRLRLHCRATAEATRCV
jgi:hypothetical protein